MPARRVEGAFCALVVGSVPIVRAGIASVLYREFGERTRIVSADWAARERVLAAAGAAVDLVVAHPGGRLAPEAWSDLAPVARGASVLVVLDGGSLPERTALARPGLGSIALDAPLPAWRRALRVAAGARFGPPPRAAAVRASARLLTERQLQVFEMLAMGLSNKTIAERLALSVGTVKLHVAAVLHALHARNRLEAVLRGRAMLPLPRALGFDAEEGLVRTRTVRLGGAECDDSAD